jgi:hypothetical protein
VLPPPALPPPEPIRHKCYRVIWCPSREDRRTMTDTQAATACVDSVLSTTGDARRASTALLIAKSANH